MKRTKVTIAYDGTNYCGWQSQPNGITVQEVVETALKKTMGQDIKVFASGRTDQGVHAVGQVFHFDNPSTIPCDRVWHCLNSVLPKDVKATDSCEVASDFNARYDVKKKTYIYKMYMGKTSLPFYRNTMTYVGNNLDVSKMQKACEKFVGKHNFLAFSSTGSPRDDYHREIFFANLEQNGEFLTFKVTGNGFLYNMVRIMVGTLIAIGEGGIPIENIERAYLEKQRNLLGKTAKPEGLYLFHVEY